MRFWKAEGRVSKGTRRSFGFGVGLKFSEVREVLEMREVAMGTR